MFLVLCWLLCASTSLSVIPESALEQLSIIEEMSAALCTKVDLLNIKARVCCTRIVSRRLSYDLLSVLDGCRRRPLTRTLPR